MLTTVWNNIRKISEITNFLKIPFLVDDNKTPQDKILQKHFILISKVATVTNTIRKNSQMT